MAQSITWRHYCTLFVVALIVLLQQPLQKYRIMALLGFIWAIGYGSFAFTHTLKVSKGVEASQTFGGILLLLVTLVVAEKERQKMNETIRLTQRIE